MALHVEEILPVVAVCCHLVVLCLYPITKMYATLSQKTEAIISKDLTLNKLYNEVPFLRGEAF